MSRRASCRRRSSTGSPRMSRTLRKSLPQAYAITVGGTVEESAKSQASVDRRRTADAVHHAHGPDDRAAKLSTPASGAQRRPPRADRRRRGAARIGPAARLRGHPRHPGAARHDHQECRHPDRADRERARPRKRRRAGRHRRQQRPLPAHHADGGIDGARHDPDRADRILGADGLRDHGRTAGRDDPHPRIPADALCRLVRRAGRLLRALAEERAHEADRRSPARRHRGRCVQHQAPLDALAGRQPAGGDQHSEAHRGLGVLWSFRAFFSGSRRWPRRHGLRRSRERSRPRSSRSCRC